MLAALSNPKLSLKARALFMLYAEKGKVLSADDLKNSNEFLEGRDALQSAINELKEARYIRTVRMQNNGQWISQLKFTEEAMKLLGTDMPFSGHGKGGHLSSNSLEAINTNTNIDTTTNVVVSIGGDAPSKENSMGWDLDGEETQPQSRSQIRRLAAMRGEDVVGAVGKVEDHQARLNAKYKKPVKAQHAGRDRINTPEELWSTNDLVAEFYELANKAAPNMSSQVNSKYVATWINKHVGEGTDRYTILKAMRMFFNDPRNMHEVGTGKPLWQRFFAYYQVVQGKVKNDAPVVYEDEDFKAQQEKMLRLLGGE